MSAYPGVLDVNCSYCAVRAGEERVTSSGRPRHLEPHRDRWGLRARLLRGGVEFVVRVAKTDDHLGVRAGEEYVAIVYWLDHSKATLLRRLPDGYDPECNQYSRDVEFVRWAQPEEATHKETAR